MSNIITTPFTEPFLSRVIDYVYDYYLRKGGDLSRLAIVFGGRRPALFIKKDLAKRIGRPYVPPQFFTIDEWMAKVAYGDCHPARISAQLDHCYAIYKLAGQEAADILQGRETFAQFLPWANEILNFIEQLDLQDVPLDSLELIGQHAQIGFSVPEDINRLLMHLVALRKKYHLYLNKNQLTTRGYQYLQASRRVGEFDCAGFDEILFCNFFYLHHTENQVIKNIYERGQAVLFMHGDERRWPALERIAKTFGVRVLEGKEVAPTKFNLHIYEAFDAHAQAGLVKEILQQVDALEDTVVVLPNTDSLLPLLTAVGGSLKEFNISMGYPLKRSALYALLELMVQAQATRRENLYYARDYLKLLQHPLVKNLNLGKDPVAVRMLVHKIEEALKGDVLTAISGSLFMDLQDPLNDDQLWQEFSAQGQLKEALNAIHAVFLKNFQDMHCAADLAKALQEFAVFMHAHSAMERYPLNTQIMVRLQQVAGELAGSTFAQEPFETRELLRILEERLSAEMVAFTGSPLRGLQILGLFETRALNFKNVIVLDVNERTLPNLNIYEPLIPREVMIKLNLDRLELEEEIQRYGFMRLISAAREVHLIYQQNTDRVRSRFVEELIWEQERRKSAIGTVEIIRPAFEVSVARKERSIPKTKEIMDFLKGFTFSASSINTYVRNPYEFYCRYVLGLKEQDDLLDDPQSRHIGTFVHNLLEEAFKGFIGKKPVIDEHFRRYFQKIYATCFTEIFTRLKRSDSFLVDTVLKTRLERFLDLEAKRCEEQVDKVLFIERRFDEVVALGEHQVRFTYRFDRVDQMVDGKVLILDYKTGAVDPMPKGTDALERLPLSRENIRDHVQSFQMPLYLRYLCRQYPGKPVDCALYHLRTMDIDFFVHKRSMDEVKNILSVYNRALEAVVLEILDPNVHFADDPGTYERG